MGIFLVAVLASLVAAVVFSVSKYLIRRFRSSPEDSTSPTVVRSAFTLSFERNRELRKPADAESNR